jgi:hypothetical protein
VALASSRGSTAAKSASSPSSRSTAPASGDSGATPR